MILSTNFSTKKLRVFFLILISLSGCKVTKHHAISVTDNSPAVKKKLLTAVLPLTNLSGTPAPLEDIRNLLIDNFEKQGLNALEEKILEKFIVSHRMRYLGGINRATAQALKWETGADAVLVSSLEFYNEIFPPKVALTARLISTGNNPAILWMDGVGLAGDDSIGVLELSLIKDPQTLLRNAADHLATSLAQYLSGQRYWVGSQRKIIKFWPKVFYRSPIFEPGTKYTVAVVPFFNLSERKFAGEIMALQFIRQMQTHENFVLVEPGIVRHALLQMRIIMDGGISLIDADSLFSKLHVDLILGGKVFNYQDKQGTTGTPKVEFSALLIERKSREVVWNCRSYHEGDDGVFFFDWGQIETAYRMASEMVLSALETMIE
ncbi:MAG: hypothetical protein JSU72_06915 [Deltaproteobacteria bacterium]|nr:MAG: hypothetical protein JSU72_06915 [Deltaproteobacteria bacterium]